MYKLIKTRDKKLIKSLLLHPDIRLTRDSSVFEDPTFEIDTTCTVWYVYYNNNKPLGFIKIFIKSEYLAEIHGGKLKECTSKEVNWAMQECITELNTTSLKYLCTYVPSSNKPALYCAIRNGFKRQGIYKQCTQSVTNCNQLDDIIILGRSI